jgi:hypothetical protein
MHFSVKFCLMAHVLRLTTKFWVSLEDVLVGIEVGDFPFSQAKYCLLAFV